MYYFLLNHREAPIEGKKYYERKNSLLLQQVGKNNSVVRSFVRLCHSNSKKLMRTVRPIEPPDLIVVFHRSLFDHPAIIAGMREGGTLIHNSPNVESVKG